MSLGDELDRLARAEQADDLDLLYQRRRDDHAPVEALFSPAIGEHAVLNIIPALDEENRALRDSVESLTLDLDRANAMIDNLRERIHTLDERTGMEHW